jgi:hypothetical protein
MVQRWMKEDPKLKTKQNKTKQNKLNIDCLASFTNQSSHRNNNIPSARAQ